MTKNNFSMLSFQNSIMQKTSKALKSLNESKAIKPNSVGNPSYREILIENKLVNDGNFLINLGKKYLGEDTQAFKDFSNIIVESIVLFNKLHMEVDIQPRLISPALTYDKSIAESTKIEIYKTHLSKLLTESFSQPLLEGKLFKKYETETKLLLESIAAADEIMVDVEKFSKYALFENCLYNSLGNILLPEYSKNEINKFIGSQSQDYFNMFTENAQVLLDQLNNNIKKLTVAIGPEIFNESAGINFIDDPKQGTDDLTSKNADVADETPKEDLGLSDDVGPIGDGNIVNTMVEPSRNVTDFDPTPEVNDAGLGFLDDAKDASEENTSTNDGEGGSTPENEIGKPYSPADKLPDSEEDKPVSIVDEINAVKEAVLSKDASNIDQTISDLYITQTEAAPEEYINIPVDQSYTEESTSMGEDGQAPLEEGEVVKPSEEEANMQPLEESTGASCAPEAFSYRQYAGAMNIFN